MLKRLRNIQIPILTKITIPYAILALLIAVGGSYLITNVIIDSVEERFTNQLIEAAFLASESIVRKEDDLLEQLRTISHLQGMTEAIDASDRESVQAISIPSAYNANIENYVIINRFGRVLSELVLDPASQAYGETNFDENWIEANFVQSVLTGQSDENGDKFSGMVGAQNAEYLFVAGPVNAADGETVGSVMVGQSLGGFLSSLRSETFAQLSFYSLEGEPRVSTLTGSPIIEGNTPASVISSQAEGSVTRNFEDNAIAYKEILVPFEVREGIDIGILGVALPTNFLTQTSQITRNNTLILMSVILFFVIIVGFYIANQITRPILDLKDAAVQVSGGNLNVRVKSTSRDEVGILANSFNEMVGNVSQSKQDLLDAYDKTIEGWAMALDLRDHETEGHSRRVTAMTLDLAKHFKFEMRDLENIKRGALLHDIGKIGIPDSILLKKGSLTDEEYDMMKQHPIFGRDFMKQIDFLSPAMDIPYGHHEKWDGSGYPQGLRGNEIPVAARLFAIVDVWDAITKDRPYRKAMSFDQAMTVIKEGHGTHFDPVVADTFIRMIGEKEGSF